MVPAPIVVRVDGPPVNRAHPRHVVFTCVTKGCVFAGAQQHDFYDYVNRAKDSDDKPIDNAYDTRVHDGKAGIYLVVQSAVPAPDW